MKDAKTYKRKITQSIIGIKGDFAVLPYKSRVLTSIRVLEDIRSVIHDTYDDQCLRTARKSETVSDIKSSISTNMLEDAENYVKDAIESLRSSINSVDVSSFTDKRRTVSRKAKAPKSNQTDELDVCGMQDVGKTNKESDDENAIRKFAEMYNNVNFEVHKLNAKSNKDE